jgi:rRNA maturation RNase YbeY
MAEINKIKFFYHAVDFPFSDRNKLKKFLLLLFKSEGKKLGQLNYVFCSDSYLQQLNKKFLSHNYKTDILTFPTLDTPNSISGEIYISVERAKVNATRFKESFKQELRRLIFHGALHLCGYRDKTERQMRIMRNQEDHFLKLYKSFT